MAKVTDRRNSELAAATERSGDYRKAWELWDKAAGETTDHKHRIWCINRAKENPNDRQTYTNRRAIC